MDVREHWQSVYKTKKPTEVSWYQAEATRSLSLIQRAAPDRSAAIIDVGGGFSTLVDNLLSQGYSNVSVLDVSKAALACARSRLGSKARRVTWLEANILEVALPVSGYEIWHDRAAFHFLTSVSDRQRYVQQVRASVPVGGHVIVATFASDGPTRCSGLEVARYAPAELHAQFGSEFQLLESGPEEHKTPSGTTQAFIYCMCRVRGSGLTRT